MKEAAEKKAEARALLEKEMNSIKPPAGKQPSSKITQAEIQVSFQRLSFLSQGISTVTLITWFCAG